MERILKLPNSHLQLFIVWNIFSFISKFVLVSLPNLVMDTSAKTDSHFSKFIVRCVYNAYF